MGKQTVQNILRYILGFLFLVAAFSKFFDPYPTGDFLNSLRILPGNFIIRAVYILTGIELILSLFLLFDYLSKMVTLLFLTVVLIATIYSTWLYLSGVSLNCGCFGGFLDREIGTWYFITNALIIVGLAVFLWLDKSISTPSS